MTRTITAALVALALVGGSLAAAKADEVVTSTTTTTGPAFGYEDGYWARDHVWHNWASPDDRVTFEKRYHAHYYSGMHTAAPDQGWREHDSYWQSR